MLKVTRSRQILPVIARYRPILPVIARFLPTRSRPLAMCRALRRRVTLRDGASCDVRQSHVTVGWGHRWTLEAARPAVAGLRQ